MASAFIIYGVIIVVIYIVLEWLPSRLFIVGYENTPSQLGDAPTPYLDDPDPPVHKCTRDIVTFKSQGTTLEGWLYLPYPREEDETFPAVVQGIGFNGLRNLGSASYAPNLAKHGRFAVLSFDYRSYGNSGGEPRQYLSPSRHVDDILAAVQYLSSRVDVIRPSQIAVFGSSYAGGHALVAAAKASSTDPKRYPIACVISQTPYLGNVAKADTKAFRSDTDAKPQKKKKLEKKKTYDEWKKRGLYRVFMGFYALVVDFIRSWLGFKDGIYVLCFGSQKKGDLAINYFENFEMTPENWRKIHPSKMHCEHYTNACLARGLLDMMLYRPISSVPLIKVPILYISAKIDGLCPPHRIRYAASITQSPTDILFSEGSHFDLGNKPFRDEITQKAIEFMHKYMIDKP